MNKEVTKWSNRITKAEKKWSEYHDLIAEIRKYYKNSKKNNKQNIFWSSIETLKPFIYFKAPTPYVERKNKNANPIEDVACKILEKALIWDLEQQDFDGVIKYARNDYLLSGLGLVYEKFTPSFKTLETTTPLGEVLQVETLESAKVETCYIDPKKLIIDCDKVNVWEDVEWVAQKIEMTKGEVVAQFGKKIAAKLIDPNYSEEDELGKETAVYRIWDKKDKRIIYFSKEVNDEFLRVDEDLLKVEGFFPFPKPIFSTMANDGVVPVPDYTEIKCLLDELDGVNNRMKLTMQAVKVSGAYDGSFPELKNILNKDVSLVNVADFERIREKGGFDGLINFMPIKQYIDALQVLAERRNQLISAIYEITGVSDIMRGNSDPNETATAVTKKTNFGTLRNQDRQNNFQRFLTEVLKIKAEVICEQFTPELLAEFSDNVDPMVLEQAIYLLKTDKIRNLALGIVTDTSFQQSEELEKTTEAVKTIHEMITSSFQVVSTQPALLGLYKQMIESMVATLPSARQFSATIEATFNRIEQALSQPKPEQPNPDVMRAETEKLKAQNDFAIKQQANAIKEQEVQLKKQAEDNKIMMENKEIERQTELKKLELAIKGETNENITTGYARGF
jgi:hypothetical protein